MKRRYKLIVSIFILCSLLLGMDSVWQVQAQTGLEGTGYEAGTTVSEGDLTQPVENASETPEQTPLTDRERQVAEARTVLGELVEEREIMSVVYLCEEYPVRELPALDASVVLTIPSGQTVEIQDARIDSEGRAWSYVRIGVGDTVSFGYIPRDYLACSDERFLTWEDTYYMNPTALRKRYSRSNSVDTTDVEQFPESYQTALLALKQAHPNWIFVKMNTGLDWDTVILSEMQGGKSLVHRSLADYNKQGAYDGGNWFYASRDILSYYMDPRNGLTENGIFQFEQLTYNENYHTQKAVEQFLNNTFMNSASNAPGTDMTFAHIFWAIGAEDGRRVSPFHLAARVYQEQGAGNSPLISGTVAGYEGYYNYFNIGATGTTNQQVIENGLAYAKAREWKGAYYSILGGADFISRDYIQKGQDTLYLQKYNVNPNASHALYTHQYMQNISAPTSEARSIRNLYAGASSLENTFVFKIPVYENMPATAVANPTSSTDVVLSYPEGYTDTKIYIDGLEYTSFTANGKHIVKVADANASTAVVYRYNENGVPVGMYVWTLSYADGYYTAEPQPKLEDLLTYHGFSIRITGKSGIRFKTGISTSLREELLTTGINGYSLKEYGTLVMDYTNTTQYPMVKDGEKVLSGMSYGTDENGNRTDVVFEMVDNRYRYTAVLVGVPADQYQTDFAFRGYLILEKDEQQITLYGPMMHRSIYSLAELLLDMGVYPVGSEAEQFLQKLITDGDAAQAQSNQEEGTSDEE